MTDKQGRNIDYVRISLTDRCNLRCVYCMPEEGVRTLSHNEILTYDEIVRVCTVMAKDGLRNIKVTGGEPLVRKNCDDLIRRLKNISGIERVTLTTNGILLKEQMPKLAQAGVDAINISLDTLDPVRFREVTRRDKLAEVLEGIYAALEYPQVQVKLNCVPVIGDNQNLTEMAGLARDHNLHVRFIEMMPVGEGKSFGTLREEDILRILEDAYGRMTPCNEKLGNGPSHYYSLEGFRGRIGFISAVTHKFCDQCNRIRLTADGFLKACLQYHLGEDLKSLLRSNCTDEQLQTAIQAVLDKKPSGHHFYEDGETSDESRNMYQIGG